MEYNEEVKFISITYGENEMGDAVEIPIERSVLASELDYRNKDFYQAMANGLKPSKTFAINKYEYQGEKELKHNNIPYKIIDVYPVTQKRQEHDLSEFETIALMCEGMVNRG